MVGPETLKAPLAISVVLPCFEEAEHLSRRVCSLARILEPRTAYFEILIVAAEAARDGTPEVAARLSEQMPCVRLLPQSAHDPGYGRALAIGVAAARYPHVLLMDADGQFDPGDVPRFLAEMAHGKAIIGYRALRADAWPRRLAGRVNTRVSSALLRLGPVRDLDCGFKLIPRHLLGPEPLLSRSGAINAEILSRVKTRGGHLVQLGVTHLPRQGGCARFELGQGLLGHVPRPSEALAIVEDLAVLTWERLWVTLSGRRHP